MTHRQHYSFKALRKKSLKLFLYLRSSNIEAELESCDKKMQYGVKTVLVEFWLKNLVQVCAYFQMCPGKVNNTGDGN